MSTPAPFLVRITATSGTGRTAVAHTADCHIAARPLGKASTQEFLDRQGLLAALASGIRWGLRPSLCRTCTPDPTVRPRCTCGAIHFGGCFCGLSLTDFLASPGERRVR